ncbi:uncharacterized protein LOC122252960 isoform X2 [Penaeus japonicus]|nr:uncharacterized protein LOC122252960 isoform X2 [Penaeus japonicus]
MDHQPETEQLNPVSPAPGVPQAPPAVSKGEVRCCGCLPLKAGTIAIGVLYLVVSLLIEALLLYVVYQGDRIDKGNLVFALFFGAISIIDATLLLGGVITKYHWFIFPWILWESINIGLEILVILILTFIMNPAAIIGLLFAGIRAHFLYVVIKYFKKLRVEAVLSQAMG